MTMRRIASAIILSASLSAFGEKAYVLSYFNDVPYGGRRGEAAGLRLAVSSDGCGFDVSAAERAHGVHLGLSSMRSRAENIGGRFAVRSAPGKGTEVKIVLEE